MRRFRSICLLIFGALTVVGSPAVSARSHDALPRLEFDIPSGPLADALVAFGERARIMIIFDNDLVDGLTAPQVSARLRPPVALGRLLGDAPLAYRKINDSTWAIIPDTEERAKALPPAPPVHVRIEPAYIDPPEEIVVTASYRAPVHHAGMRALYTIDGEQLRLQGALNVAEPIFELPATVSSVTSANTALFLATAGLNLADLRGLGPQRTLVLVNGRRYVRTAGGNGEIIGVDLNSIPTPFVERIEIVNQGAGAAIGADAVAGAINIVTRESIDGIAATVDGGVSEKGDAEEYAFSVLAGKSFMDDRANITLGATFGEEPSLIVQERDRLTMPFGFMIDGRQAMPSEDATFAPGFSGSSFTPLGRLSAVQTASGEVIYTGGDVPTVVFSPDGASFDPFVGSLDQLYDWTTDFSALPEIDRLIGYGSASFQFANDHKLYSEAHFAKTEVRSQIASSPVSAFGGSDPVFGDGIFVPADNPFVPAGLIEAAEAGAGSPVTGLVLTRRFIELGPRVRDIERETFQIRAGVEGSLGGEWRYDVSYQFGRNLIQDKASGIASGEQLAIALDVDRCASVAGCTPINIFGSTNITSAQAEFIRATPRERALTIREQVVQAKATGPLFENQGEQAFLTAGVDYRREALNDEPDLNFLSERALGEFLFPGADGSVGFTEFFANATAPIIVGAPYASMFEIGGALRYVSSGGGPDFLNISGNARWSPIDGVNLYGHVFRGGRSPNVVELFGAGPDVGRFFRDPCGDTDASATIMENCASSGLLGVAPGFGQTNNIALVRFTGNPTLDEERVRSHIIGAAVDIHGLFPDLPGSLTVSADWRNHRVTDIVNFLPALDGLFKCYESVGLSDEFCGVNPATGRSFIQRDPATGQVVALEGALSNGGSFQTNGLDGRLQFVADLDGPAFVDTFSVDVLYTYTHRVRESSFYKLEEERLDGLVDHPRHQLHLTASLGGDPLKTVWTVRRRGSALSGPTPEIPEARIPAMTYVDAAVQFRPTANSIVFVGIENIFDRDPPIVYGATGNTFYEYYDIIGRRFFAGVKAEF